MARFFVAKEELGGNVISLTEENAAHGRVLRLKLGDQVSACDGEGQECLCRVCQVSQNEISLEVLERGPSKAEASVFVSVYMAFPKADKLEHVIQKATELGACEIVAFPSARCVSRPDEKTLGKKLERWRKIAASAAEQSGRGIIPRVRTLPSYEAAVKEAAGADLPVLFYENERACTFAMAISRRGDFRTVSLMTGPEGGLEPSEVEKAGDWGMEICTLGRRILRCETAPLCALSAVMFAAGEF